MKTLSLLVLLSLVGCQPVNTRVHNDEYRLDEKIDKQSTKDFIYHAKHFKIDTLYLNSSGGSVYDSFKIVDMVNKKNIYVVVKYGDYCRSACTFIVALSNHKRVDGFLGIHAPSYRKVPYRYTTGDDRKELDNIKQYLLNSTPKHNVSERFVIDTFNTPNERMVFMSGRTFNEKYLINKGE